ncbi:hypothetical protein [Polaribacter sp.]|uniref:hypothetical protein n=1 Tax=Polaribacter sp. TaxID=1920175 RepID=UPI00404716DE
MEILFFLPIIIIVFGFFLWKSALNNYGYNIFGIWVLVRLLIAVIVFFNEPYSGTILLILVCIWNFIVTWKNTSLIIAIFAVLLQPFALYAAIGALNKLVKIMNGE